MNCVLVATVEHTISGISGKHDAQAFISLSVIAFVSAYTWKLLKVWPPPFPSSSVLVLQIDCAVRCLAQGIGAAHIIDGRARHSILMELLTNEGVGTMITG